MSALFRLVRTGAAVLLCALVLCSCGGAESAAVSGPDWQVYDELVSAAEREADVLSRAQLLREAEELLNHSGAVAALYDVGDDWLLGTAFSALTTTPYADKDFSRVSGGTVLSAALTSLPQSLDPALSGVGGATVALNMFSGLCHYAADGTVAMELAESYAVSDDGLIWTFTLKDGLRWSDGSALSAADFAAAWRRAADPATDANYSYLFAAFSGYGSEQGIDVTAEDELTLTAVLSRPCVYLAELCCHPVFMPVKCSEAENDTFGESGEISSSGPFAVADFDGERLVLKRNEYYYAADEVTLQTLEFSAPPAEQAAAEFAAGALDFCDTVPAAMQQSAQCARTVNTVCAVFNVTSKWFENLDVQQAAAVRRALSLALEREQLAALGAQGRAASSYFVPAQTPNCSGGSWRQDDGCTVADLDAARQELAAAGVDAAGLPTLEYLTVDSEQDVALAQLICEQLAALGVTVEIRALPAQEYIQALHSGDYTLARWGWVANYNDAADRLAAFVSDSADNVARLGA